MSYSRRTILGRTGLASAAIAGVAHGIGTVGAADANDSSVGRIDGTVTDFGHPIDAATVAFEDASGLDETSAVDESATQDSADTAEIDDDPLATETDDDGSYAQSLDSGSYRMTVTADGYTTATRSVTIDPEDAVTVDIQLDPAWGPEEGMIDLDVTPAGGGSTLPSYVTIYGDEVYEAFAPRGSIPDPTQGGRGFVVSEGWWEIRVSNANGFSDGYKRVYVEAGDTVRPWIELNEGDQTISSTGSLVGQFTDDSGDPIADSTLTIDDDAVPIADDGSFERTVDHGRYEVEATAPGYESKSGTVDIRFARTTELIVTLDPDEQ